MARGSNMDPTHHDKIVDKLMQYKGKIPKTGQLSSKNGQIQCYQMRMNIDHLILLIDSFAVAWEKEVIK
jgi:hypothetical protein